MCHKTEDGFVIIEKNKSFIVHHGCILANSFSCRGKCKNIAGNGFDEKCLMKSLRKRVA